MPYLLHYSHYLMSSYYYHSSRSLHQGPARHWRLHGRPIHYHFPIGHDYPSWVLFQPQHPKRHHGLKWQIVSKERNKSHKNNVMNYALTTLIWACGIHFIWNRKKLKSRRRQQTQNHGEHYSKTYQHNPCKYVPSPKHPLRHEWSRAVQHVQFPDTLCIYFVLHLDHKCNKHLKLQWDRHFWHLRLDSKL